MAILNEPIKHTEIGTIELIGNVVRISNKFAKRTIVLSQKIGKNVHKKAIDFWKTEARNRMNLPLIYNEGDTVEITFYIKVNEKKGVMFNNLIGVAIVGVTVDELAVA